MKTLLVICLVALGVLVGCGAGPTAPKEAPPTVVEAPPAPTPKPTPVPCRPWPKCMS